MAIEPAESPVLSGGVKGEHYIGGIGAGFVPPLYRADLVDEVYKVSSEQALKMTQIVAKCEGLPVGVSAAAALVGAINMAQREEMCGKNIVVVLPDSIERYLSNPFFKQNEQDV